MRVKDALCRIGLKAQKYSPEIAIGIGITGLLAGTVGMFFATKKIDKVLEEKKEKEEKIAEYVNTEGYSEDYTEEDHKKDLTIVKVQAGLKIAKEVAPIVAIDILSVMSIVKGHNITRERYAGLAAAYVAVDSSYRAYRDRITKKYGEDAEKQIRYDIHEEEVEKIVTDDEGNETVAKKTASTFDPNLASDYARIWGEGCTGWTKDPELNLTFLKNQQRYFTDYLRTCESHILCLNQVYEALGFPKTKAGQIVGWYYDEKNPVGDNFVDFGIYDPNNAAFANMEERCVLLDFNVDGNILPFM